MQLSDRIGRRMKLQDLHVLLIVIQCGSMGKAAQRLSISQPAISRSISELEHAFGVRLLDRHPQGVEPTEYGRALLDCGIAVFDDLRQGVKNIEFLADPAGGEVRIGSIAPVAASFVSSVVAGLSQRYPQLLFHLMTTQAETLHQDLYERKVDLLVARRLDTISDERQDFELLFNDSHVVAAGAHSPWARRRRIALADLVNEPWVLPPPETVTGSVAMDAFRAKGLERPRITVVTNSLEVRLSLLGTGHFLAIVTTSMLRFPTNRREIKVLPIELPGTTVPTGIVTLKNRSLNPAAHLFIKCAREEAKALAPRK